MYEIRCSSCHLRGMVGDNRVEMENLTDVHNDMAHQRAPVARIHRVHRFRRRRATPVAGNAESVEPPSEEDAA